MKWKNITANWTRHGYEEAHELKWGHGWDATILLKKGTKTYYAFASQKEFGLNHRVPAAPLRSKSLAEAKKETVTRVLLFMAGATHRLASDQAELAVFVSSR